MFSKAKIINGSLASIPWEEASKIYTNAGNNALHNAILALEAQYDEWYQKERQRRELLAESFNPEAGSFEGDVNLEYKLPELSQDEKRKIINTAGDAALLEFFIKPYQLKSFGMKVMEEILVLYKNHKLNNAGEDGTICGLQYMNDNFDPKDHKALGIYRFLMYNQRSSWLSGSATKEGKRFNNLVPLILFAHKLYNNVDYSRWSRKTLRYVVNSHLCEAMLTELPELTIERALELRDIGLTAKGEKRSALTTYMLYGLNSTELGKVPNLSKIMALQVWCAHPNNRTKYMVLDPKSWDTMPTPLIKTDIFEKPAGSVWDVPTEPVRSVSDLPWL
jgi:hypothetical protein